MHWLYLMGAILVEVLATSALKMTPGFARLGTSMAVMAGYGAALYLMSLALQTLPLGIAYALWSAAGIALVSLAGYLLYGERLGYAALVGLVLIAAGTVLVSSCSGLRVER